MSNTTSKALEMDVIALCCAKDWARELVKYGDLRYFVAQAIQENPAESDEIEIVKIVRDMVKAAETEYSAEKTNNAS
ncbi:MAG: hypothetical protein M3P98_04185 [bacterium]|nr:hypothetical protein [bacterium]